MAELLFKNKNMTIEKCKCGCDTFKINSQTVNGGYTAERICTNCGDVVEIIDTYDDND